MRNNQMYPDFQGMVVHANSLEELMQKLESIGNSVHPNININPAPNNSEPQILYKYIARMNDSCYTGIVKAFSHHMAIDMINKSYPNATCILEPITIAPNSIVQIDEYTIVDE